MSNLIFLLDLCRYEHFKLEKLKDFIDEQGLIINYTNLALYNYKYGNFRKAQKFIDLALEKCSFRRRRDIFSSMSLFKMLVLYDEKKYEDILEVTEGVYRKLYQHKMNFEPELLIIHFFKTTPFSILSKRELIQYFELFREKMQTMIKQNMVKQAGFFHYINVDSWIGDKINELVKVA